MKQDKYEQGLAAQVDRVFEQHPDLHDHRVDYPWLTGSLGDPTSGIWFVAENPSLTMVERATNPGGGAITKEAQWFASKGDQLFREALIANGFKDGAWDAIGGWNCYITNVIKEADYTARWRKISKQDRRTAAEIWSPVLRWELEQSRPKLVVMMGNQVVDLLRRLAGQRLVCLPDTEKIDHYSYVAYRPRGKLGPMHPERVAGYRRRMANVRQRYNDVSRP